MLFFGMAANIKPRMKLTRSLSARLRISKLICSPLAAAALAMTLTHAEAAVSYSLADDFSITANGGSNPWSYGYDNVAGEPVQFGALTSNTRNANQLWNTDFASPPTMWSDATGYWGIGKNTSGVAQTSSSGIIWNPNEVLLRPKATDPFPGRLVIGWTAPTGPASNVVNVTCTFERALAAGNVGYSLVKRASGVDTVLVGWTGSTSGGVLSNSLTGLMVMPGDKLFWRIDSWGPAVEDDITKATIEVEIESFYSVEAWSPTPENGAKVLHESAAALALGWNAGDGAVQHDLYFGTNATDVANATPADVSGIYQGRQAGLSFLPGTLDASTLYYWRVDEVDAESGVVTGAVWSFEITAELRDLYADTWVAIDGLDRVLPGVQECGPPRADKLVFMFYLSWLGGHGTDGPYDLTKLLADNPTDPAFGPQHSFHHWGEPEVGYYTSKDEWVMRRHIHYLSDAGVDVLILDATNGFLYEEEYMLLCSVMRKLKYEGEKVPRIVFWTHSGSPATVTSLYNSFYSNGYFEDLWFYRDGKPLHLGFPDGADGDPDSVSQVIRDFFTWREFWLLDNGDKWGTDDYPQDYGWDISSDKPTQASVVVGSQATRNMGQSFHNFTSPVLDAYGLPVNGTEGQGLMFIEQFDRVLQLDPEIVTVFRWNEWVAQRFISGLNGSSDFLGNPTVEGESFFVDCYNAEFNSDIEPMKGGYTDNYYYQFIDYVRQYKGVRTPPPTSHAQTISIDGDFSEWADVQPEFRDHVSDTTHRNCQGWGSAGIYTNTTGRNDLLNLKVARDASNIYFYAETAEPMTSHTDANWMLLFIDADQDHATGWEGYDYLVNHQVNSSSSTTLKQTTGGWSWTTASDDISYMARATSFGGKI